MVRSAILGVGHYLPTKVVTNHDLAKLMPTSDEWIQQRTGIKERRFIERDGIGASDLAVPAARMAVERAGRAVGDVDMIIFATLSPDVQFPGSGCLLGDKLGLPGVPALDVRNQCSGFLYSLSIADAWVRTGAYRNVLVVGSEVHSTGIELAERGRDVAVLVGDGAAAALVGPSPSEDRGVLSLVLRADGAGAKDLWLPAPASMRSPARITHDMLDRGEHYPQMNGKQVFRWATEKMPEVAKEALSAAGLGIGDVDYFVPHQANMRINQMVAQKLGIPADRVCHNIERYGNTTAATIPLGLSEAYEEGRLGEGKVVLTAAFGSGYTWAASVIRF
jgi:3-oxoacyl-[acyl-carrier-protein] synthase III